MASAGDNSSLRYLNAARLQSPTGEQAALELRDRDDQRIGSLDGVLIDPVERRLLFYVVEPAGRPRAVRYLLPTDCHAHMTGDGRSLRIDLDAEGLARCQEFESSSVPGYSDDDFMEAMFRPRSA